MQRVDESALDTKSMAGRWLGLGWWNLYFVAKLLLYWAGYLNFNAFYNLLFAAALLLPLPQRWMRGVRHLVAVPVGVALLYHDTWFPPFSRLLAQPEVLGFSLAYLVELLGRFINWNLVGAGFIVLVAYLYLSQWLRMTAISVIALTLVALSNVVSLPTWPWRNMQGQLAAQAQGPAQPQQVAAAAPVAAARQGKPSSQQLDDILQAFYQTEKSRRVGFPAAPSSTPFDVLLINICSLAWSDLEASGLATHPLLANMDVIFDDFNSATSYSGPAVLRLMRASCGQPAHNELYQPADGHCYLLENLRALGYINHTALNHDGSFQGFLDEITAGGRFPQPYVPTGIRPSMTGFDNSPIWDDLEALSGWWNTRLKSGAERAALLYNTISLHDGNREATADGGGRSAPFSTRAQRMFDELNAFIEQLERSGRKAVVVLIPEHGAALEGDRMQIAGMREVPASSITHVPVGVRLVGAKSSSARQVAHVQGHTSYLALSELLSRLLAADVFAQDSIDWTALTADLPQTPVVSENEGTVLMVHDGIPYIRMGGRNWIEYPR